jgi:N-acetylmuramoyl-L-alanine amidase
MNQTPPLHRKPPIQGARLPKFSFWSSLGTVVSIAIVVATLFTIWTPASLFNNRLSESLSKAIANSQKSTQMVRPTPTNRPIPHIGLVAGHWDDQKNNGFVCPDGLKESDVNLNIATMVQQRMVAEGFTVDLMKEKDTKLMQYSGLLVLSIHNDTCNYIDNSATGFKVATSYYTETDSTKANRLVDCITDRYQKDTGLRFINTITDDMSKYHTFDEVNTNTPTVIMETGYLNLDRDLLTKQTDKVVQGITDGLLCYLRNQPTTSTETPAGNTTPASITTLDITATP